MATEYYAGTSGRIKLIKVAPSTSTDMITWTGSTAALVEAQGWELTLQRDGGVPEALTLESEADAENVLYPTLIRGGVGRWTGSMTCLVDGDATNSFEKLPPNCAFVGDFIFQKSSGDGFIGVKCVISGMPIKTGVQEKAASYTVNFSVSGKLPDPTI